MDGYLITGKDKDCVGCEACVQICGHGAIEMEENKYGFFYPKINFNKCVRCGLCNEVCLMEHKIIKHESHKISFGGYIKDVDIRNKSTSGGAFTAICRAYCTENYVIYGAAAKGLEVYHKQIDNIDNVGIFYSSKYAHSIVGDSYKEIRNYLKEGKQVLFSGVPCQVAGLYRYLKNINKKNLLTVEVLCTGIPSSQFMRKYNDWCLDNYNSSIEELNYRYTGNNKWDDQSMYVRLNNGRIIITDRWFSNFYSIFLQRLMSRPACNECRFVTDERVADITLSDLWGVDREYPELYDNGAGCSWIICNSDKGCKVFQNAKNELIGREVDYETMRKYQRPGLIKKDVHPKYEVFMEDLLTMDYKELCSKWSRKPSLRLLFEKKVWNNRNRVRVWRMKKNFIGVIKNSFHCYK